MGLSDEVRELLTPGPAVGLDDEAWAHLKAFPLSEAETFAMINALVERAGRIEAAVQRLAGAVEDKTA